MFQTKILLITLTIDFYILPKYFLSTNFFRKNVDIDTNDAGDASVAKAATWKVRIGTEDPGIAKDFYVVIQLR